MDDALGDRVMATEGAQMGWMENEFPQQLLVAAPHRVLSAAARHSGSAAALHSRGAQGWH